jgi:hypothetical protein
VATTVEAMSTQAVIEAKCREYSEERPNKSLGGLTPTVYAGWQMTETNTVTAGLQRELLLKTAASHLTCKTLSRFQSNAYCPTQDRGEFVSRSLSWFAALHNPQRSSRIRQPNHPRASAGA